LSIERRPHFNGRITYWREIVRDGRGNNLKAEEIEDEEMRKYEGGKMRRYSVNLIKTDRAQRYNKSAIHNPKLLLKVGLTEFNPEEN